jgi:DNA helicase-2/ATP-dependent DNA helicase PcrA
MTEITERLFDYLVKKKIRSALMDLFDHIMSQEPVPTQNAEIWHKSAVGTGKSLLDGLNPQQAQAVQHRDGPLLILAGAGSGKTRVITHRIVWLVQNCGVRPSAILAITFTNKAAAEMKTRIEALVGPVSAAMWIGTFHSMLLRILRRYADRIGYSSHFTILDTDDQQRVIKQCCKELSIDEKRFPVRMLHGRISAAKNELIGVEAYAKDAGSDFIKEKTAQIYKMYQQVLKQNNSMDFDDILFESVRLLENNEDVLREYQTRFNYILVDEYQDTNHAQYKLVHMLSAAHTNLCVVGDDDQSIYSFRGANIRNILDFEKDFKQCTVIKLEQNYRSSNHVLQAANAVIKNNRGRKSKQLRTNMPDGDLITFYRGENQTEEARYIAREISRMAKLDSRETPFGQIAILYRLNALSRNLEFALREQGIPYRIFGSTRFYDRKEIKDVMAYLRLAFIPEDRLAFTRIINTPRRGVGDATLAAIESISAGTGLSPLEICRSTVQYPELNRAGGRLLLFSEFIDSISAAIAANELTLAELIEKIEDESGIVQEIIDQQERSAAAESVDRIENLKELLSDALEFENQHRQTVLNQREQPDIIAPEDALNLDDSLAGVLSSYLERSTLYSDIDSDSDQDYVRLMTIHSAKGLEFDTVFLVGAEEGLFPGFRSMESESGIEEERRLAYVAITRARAKLVITTAKTRLIFGQTQALRVSPFILEIPDKYVEEIGGPRKAVRYGNSADYRGGSPIDKNYVSSSRLAGNNKNSDSIFAFSGPAQSNDDKKQKDETGKSDLMKLHKGDLVRHRKFGEGRIEQVTPVANDAILVVDFKQFGTKRLMARMAPLEKI